MKRSTGNGPSLMMRPGRTSAPAVPKGYVQDRASSTHRRELGDGALPHHTDGGDAGGDPHRLHADADGEVAVRDRAGERGDREPEAPPQREGPGQAARPLR